MMRLLASLVLGILANAVGLMAAAFFLDDFGINSQSFIAAVLIYSVTNVVLGPLIVKIALTSAPYLVGGITLVTTLVSLIVTNLITDGITISNLKTWIAATLIVWLFSIIGSLVLPLIFFKKTLQKAKENRP